MEHLALVKIAGMMASKLLDLPITPEEISDSVNYVAQAWVDNTDALPDAERGVIALREFITKHGESRFKRLPADDRQQIPNLAGYWHKENSEYYLTKSGWEEACSGFNASDVAEQLKVLKLLRHDDRRNTVKVEIDQKRPRLYAISAAILDDGDDESSADAPPVEHAPVAPVCS
jgi:hypothetical protein